jgi:nucleotide-binding universal stress UspA family protein
MSKPMKRYGIVVGIDGSAASNAAVRWAAHEAAMRHISLTLVHMVKPAAPVYPEMSLSADAAVSHEDEGRRVLDEGAKIAEDAATASRKIAISRELRVSRPVPTLAEMSEKAEMVVVGSNGRGAVARVLLGSVSSGVVRSARCPVAVIRAEAPFLSHPEHAPVLVGIDRSPTSELAVDIAFDEASRRGVELTALHATGVEVFEPAGAFQDSGFDWEALKSEVERSLAEYLVGWHERYPDVMVNLLAVFGLPGRELIEESKAAQLVVVGSHGRGGLTRMLLGSVSNAVVHSAHTPAIVARPC